VTYAQFFLPREVRWCWQTFGCHSDDLELFLLERCVPVQATGCWEWSGPRLPTGYGRFRFGDGVYYAHRTSQELWTGPLTAARPHALHSCDNPPCINPVHLRSGTQQDNIADRVERGRSRSAEGPHPSNWVTNSVPAPACERTRRTKYDPADIFLLRSKGLTMAQIAVQIGSSQAHVCLVLQGKRMASRTERLRSEVFV
jgi:hypothetical protein